MHSAGVLNFFGGAQFFLDAIGGLMVGSFYLVGSKCSACYETRHDGAKDLEKNRIKGSYYAYVFCNAISCTYDVLLRFNSCDGLHSYTESTLPDLYPTSSCFRYLHST
jgi:hypothetical protein